MNRKDELQSQIAALRAELHTITDAEDMARDRQLLGRYFKYRNCYSMPDYWWLYATVASADADSLKVFRFQTDRDGRIEVEPSAFYMAVTLERDYIEISREEFQKAWAELRRRIVELPQ